MREKAQVSASAVIGITVIVAIAFAGIGYTLAPNSLNEDKVMEYMKEAPDNELREIISVVPETVINEEARKIFPMMIKDDLDRGVVISEKPDNIISLAPSVTETLFALGLDNKIIGVTEYCDYPPKVSGLVENGELEIVGGYTSVNTEKIVGLNPDLVVTAAGVSKDTIKQLEKMGISVVGIEGENISDVMSDIRLVGRITGTPEKAQEITQNMKSNKNEILNKIENISKGEKPKVFYMVGANPIYTVGPGTFIHEIINLAGGVNIAENIKMEYSSMTEEEIIDMNPDVFVIAVHGSELPLSTVDSVKDRFEGIDAVEENSVYKLSPGKIDVFHRAGPRLIEALEKMTSIVHPDLEISS